MLNAQSGNWDSSRSINVANLYCLYLPTIYCIFYIDTCYRWSISWQLCWTLSQETGTAHGLSMWLTYIVCIGQQFTVYFIYIDTCYRWSISWHLCWTLSQETGTHLGLSMWLICIFNLMARLCLVNINLDFKSRQTKFSSTQR